jgi:hypothetical protein
MDYLVAGHALSANIHAALRPTSKIVLPLPRGSRVASYTHRSLFDARSQLARRPNRDARLACQHEQIVVTRYDSVYFCGIG